MDMTSLDISQPGVREHRIAATKSLRISWGSVTAWVFLIVWLLMTLFPLYWIVRMAFSTQKLLLASPTRLAPVGFTFDAFRRVLGMLPLQTVLDQGGSPKVMQFDQYLITTLFIVLITTTTSMFFNAMAAYAFARLRFPFRNQIFYLYIIVQIMPSVLGLIPNFILIQQLGWVGTVQGIMAPAFLGNAFGIFFLRQFLLGLNRELEEAAMLDGDSYIGIFFHIILPNRLTDTAGSARLHGADGWHLTEHSPDDRPVSGIWPQNRRFDSVSRLQIDREVAIEKVRQLTANINTST
jgi:multiple sugar transport system permease protein